MGIKDFFMDPQQTDGGAESRFVLRTYQLGGMVLYQITDRETGVSYITKPGNDCPLTPLLDADGTPAVEYE